MNRPAFSWVALALVFLAAAPAWAQAVPGRLAAARDLYFSGRYAAAAKELAVIAQDPSTSPTERVDALKHHAFCLYLLNDPEAARKAWQELLAIQPHYRLDPVEVSPDLRTFFERITGPPPPAPAAEPPAAYVPPPTWEAAPATALTPPRGCGTYLCLVPFGVGQFANGKPVKGAVFAGAEAVFLSLNIGLYWTRVSSYDRRDRAPDAGAADRSYLMQNVFFGLFVATAVAGVVDAFVWQ